MELTAKEIIPDRSFASYDEIGLNLYGARHMLNKFLRMFSRKGFVNQDCLYEILQMDLDQAREFLISGSNTKADIASLDPGIRKQAGQTFAVLQMMIHLYLNEHMLNTS